MIKKLLAFVFVLTILLMPINNVKAGGLKPPKPLIPPDCGAVANAPYVYMGSEIVGVGGLNCAATQTRIDITVELSSSNGGHTYQNYSCYNTRNCTIPVGTTYVSGLSWQTEASGYTQGYGYYHQSSWTYIP